MSKIEYNVYAVELNKGLQMTFTITKGMAGRKVESIGKYTSDSIDKMFADFFEWKQKNKDSKKYYIASYERHIMKNEDHQIIIDFGDYSYFGLIKANKKEWKALMEHKCKPVSLEV